MPLAVCANGEFSVDFDAFSSNAKQATLVFDTRRTQNFPFGGFDSAVFASLKSPEQGHLEHIKRYYTVYPACLK